MNYIKHLTGFFNRIAVEESVNPTHISLYITIFQFWNLNRFNNPVLVSREEIMKISKIGSNATYHKCIKDLERMGYLKYNPSFNPHSGTSITVNDFTQNKKVKSDNSKPTRSNNEQVKSPTLPKNEQVHDLALSKIDNVSEQLYIYNKTYTNNNKNIYGENQNFEFSDTCSNNEQVQESVSTDLNKTKKQKEKSSAKKEKTKPAPELFPDGEKRPSLKLVKDYFSFQQSNEFEAERFFNYYSSNGWLIGGKSKMEDWKASARNWMLNTGKFSANIPKNVATKEYGRAQNLHTNTDKDYSEPL